MGKDWQFRYKNAKKKELLQEFSSWSNDDLVNHILELRSVINEMQKELNDTNDEKNYDEKKPIIEGDFKQEWSYPTKLAFLLALTQKPLTSEEIHKLLLKLDSHYKDYDKPRNNLTVTISRAIKSGRIKKIKMPGIRSLYYILPDWLNKDGDLKHGYKIDSLF